jgi:glycogen debranching enzyme
MPERPWLELLGLESSGRRLSELQITVPKGRSREYVYTDGDKSYLMGEARLANTRGYHGLTFDGWRTLESWELTTGGQRLAPECAVEARFFPHGFARMYGEGSTETVVVPDGSGALIVDYDLPEGQDVELALWMDMRPMKEFPRQEYRVSADREDLILISSRGMHVAFAFDRPVSLVGDESIEERTYSKSRKRRSMGSATVFTPGHVLVPNCGGQFPFVAVAAWDPKEAISKAVEILSSRTDYCGARAARMSGLLNEINFCSSSDELNKAFDWAYLSLDALLMKRGGDGIFAGLPWFAEYWGRDSFISFPGAILPGGRFEEGRRILQTFAEAQETDSDSPNLGRIPNLTSPEVTIYNSGDAPWWYIRAVSDYLMASGDLEFVRSLFGVIRTAVDGALSKKVDKHGCVTHGNSDTWMDAGGEANPRTPRGTRAVEIQALWFEGLNCAIEMAALLGEDASFWEKARTELEGNFEKMFWNESEKCLYDYLDSSDKPNDLPRPNQIFALSVPSRPLFSKAKREKVLSYVIRKCMVKHGICSLSPDSPDFHPVHIDWSKYHFDDAYHNGDVWIWLSGPVITAISGLGRKRGILELLKVEIDDILNWGAVGTLAELKNGADTGVENVEGTITQAWSLAEFIRNVYQDLLGFKPNVPKGVLTIRPNLPAGLTRIQADISYGEGKVRVSTDGAEIETEAIGCPMPEVL